MKRTEKLLRNQNEIEEEIEYDMGNFFDRKKKFDFRHFDLFRLEFEYLRTNVQENKEKEVTFKDYEMNKSLKDFYILNNRLILENFQTQAAQEITAKFHPEFQKTVVVDEILESSFCKFFGLTERKKFDLITR